MTPDGILTPEVGGSSEKSNRYILTVTNQNKLCTALSMLIHKGKFPTDWKFCVLESTFPFTNKQQAKYYSI